jgi:hypothetical protein
MTAKERRQNRTRTERGQTRFSSHQLNNANTIGSAFRFDHRGFDGFLSFSDSGIETEGSTDRGEERREEKRRNGEERRVRSEGKKRKNEN